MRKLPPLGALRVFEAAARLMSFKAAAGELCVSATAISHQVRLLEQYCGHSLFRRRPRPLSLTPFGERLYPILRDGLDSFAQAIAEVSRKPAQPLPLRVTTTNAFAHRWLVPRLRLWREYCPDIALDVIGTDAVIDVRGGEADIAVRYQRDPPVGLEAHELFRDTFWPVCVPELLSAAPVVRAGDLSRHTLIHMGWNPAWEPHVPSWRRWVEAARERDPVTPDLLRTVGLSFREELHAIEAVIAGQGVAIASDVLVARELASGALVRAHDLPLPGFGFYLAFVADHPRRAVLDTFHAWIRSVD